MKMFPHGLWVIPALAMACSADQKTHTPDSGVQNLDAHDGPDAAPPDGETSDVAEDDAGSFDSGVADASTPMPPGAPALFFSDLVDGPISGWSDSPDRGAAVSIWGYHFGTQRGLSTVTVCGVTLTEETDYAEWGATTNPQTASGQQRITFWLNSDMQVGPSAIQVETEDGISRELPFYCRNSGTIYFLDPTHGNDDNNGLLAEPGSGSDGPKQTLSWARGNLQAGDIAYLRRGIYDHHDHGESMFHRGGLMTFGTYGGGANHNNGTANNSIAVVGYPGELADLRAVSPNEDGQELNAGIKMMYGGTFIARWIFSKLQINASSAAISLGGMPSGYTDGGMSHVRIVGIDATTVWSMQQSWGCIFTLYGSALGAEDLRLYGNYLHDQLADYRGHVDDRQRAYQVYIGGYGELNEVHLGWNEMAWGSQGRGVQIYGHLSGDSIDNLHVHDNWFHHNNRQCVILGGGDSDGPNYGFVRNAYFYNNVVAYSGDLNDDSWATIVIGGVGGGRFGGNYTIYNNTFIGDTKGFPVFNITGHLDSCVLRNNIIAGAPSGFGYYTYHPDDPPAGLSGDHNLYSGNDESAVPAWDSSTLRNTSPGFVNSNPQQLADFSLLPSSAARNAGAEEVQSMVATDILGSSRPQNGAYDIGAFELP